MMCVYKIMSQKNSKEIHFLAKVVMDIFIYLSSILLLFGGACNC